MNTRRWISFDIETAKITPDDDTDIHAHRPLGITCAAVAWVGKGGEIATRDYCGLDDHGKPTVQMTMPECRSFVDTLRRATGKGFTLVGHNIAGFDLDILAEESGMIAECAELARHAVDSCYHVHALKGFPVGLEAIAKGLGLAGKTEGVSGANAPELWADGQYSTVLEYVAQDAKLSLEVALEVERLGYLKWIAKSGRLNRLDIPHWLTVDEASRLPLPDTSWMTEPLPRDRFTAWLGSAVAVGVDNPFG